ncbi:MAG TPA: hypothetical protein VIA61_18415 [Methylomirabilota bacterium]
MVIGSIASRRSRPLIALLAVALVVTACVSRERRYAEANERGLAEAGFQKRVADTPAKMAHLQTLTQRKILVYSMQGRLVYVWADAKRCQCLYVGGESQYQAYARLAEEQRIEQERRTAAEENEAAGLFGETWGPDY